VFNHILKNLKVEGLLLEKPEDKETSRGWWLEQFFWENFVFASWPFV